MTRTANNKRYIEIGKENSKIWMDNPQSKSGATLKIFVANDFNEVFVWLIEELKLTSSSKHHISGTFVVYGSKKIDFQEQMSYKSCTTTKKFEDASISSEVSASESSDAPLLSMVPRYTEIVLNSGVWRDNKKENNYFFSLLTNHFVDPDKKFNIEIYNDLEFEKSLKEDWKEFKQPSCRPK